MSERIPRGRADRPRRRARASQPRDGDALAAGLRGVALDVVAAWKDVLLAVAIVAALAAARSLPRSPWADRLALAYAAIVVGYRLVPQVWLGGERDHQGRALRTPPPPASASPRYVLGRLARRSTGCGGGRASPLLVGVRRGRRGLAGSSTSTSCRCSGGATRACRAGSRSSSVSRTAVSPGLPENWILNTGDEEPAAASGLDRSSARSRRRTCSSSSLLLLAASGAGRGRSRSARSLFVGPPLHAHAGGVPRAAVGLVVLALRSAPLVRPPRSRWRRSSASVAFVASFPTIGPTTTYTRGGARRACARTPPVGGAGREHDPLTGGRRVDIEPPARTCETGCAPSCATRRATGSGTPA